MVKTKPRKQKDKPKASPSGPTARPARTGTQAPTISFSRINAIYLSAGAVAIGIGFYLLAQGSMTLAPILLVLGYCVLLPIGIIKK